MFERLRSWFPGDMPQDAPGTVEVLTGVIATLNQTIVAQREENAKQRQENEKQRKEIAKLVVMVEGMTRQLDQLLHERDEERRAELARMREEASKLGQEVAGKNPSGRPTKPEPKAERPKPNRHNHGKSPVPEHLERDTLTLRPEHCSACASPDLAVADKLMSREYHYIQAHLRVRETERIVMCCQNCGCRVTPAQPPMPFERASCTFGLLAWLVFTRCGLFIPLDRLLGELERQGATIPSATATRWWKRGTDLLLPVAESVRLSLLQGTHIRTDGTGLRIIHAARKDAPKRDPYNGQVLVFGDDHHAVFAFTETKEGRHALDFLTLGHDEHKQPILWKGTITADAVSSQDCLFADGDRIETGCNSHGLRKFRDDEDKAPLLAAKAMGFIGRIYTIEEEAKRLGLTGPDLLAHRQQHARTVVDQFEQWLDAHITELLPKNPVRKAMQYYKNHWAALTRFLDDPDVPLDNNWSERALRKIALYRNNSLFASGEDGAVRLCTALTLIGTCRLVGVDPCAYLEWAMQRTVPHPDNRGLKPADLTPAAYKLTLG